MNRFQGPTIALRGQRITVDLVWFIPALALAAPTGWQLTSYTWPESETTVQVLASAFLPLTILLVSVVYRAIHVVLVNEQIQSYPNVRVGPFGALPNDYTFPEHPAQELVSELKAIAVTLAAGVLLLGVTLLAGANWPSVLLLPGIFISSFGLIQIMPAIPFSGGYIFRSVFWYLHDRQTTGTRAAFLYSQLVASAALGFGLFLMIWNTELLLAGFWSLFAGVYILQCSRSELLRSTLIERASDVRAADALSGLNPTVRAVAPLPEALDILLEQRENGPALVRDRNVYVGMLNLESIRAHPRASWESLTAADALVSFEELIWSDPGTDLLTVLKLLRNEPGSTVIVRESDGSISGLVDTTMEPRLLLRRGIARTIRNASGEPSSREGPKTS